MVANSDYLLSNNVWLYVFGFYTDRDTQNNGLKSILIQNFLFHTRVLS